MQQTAAEKAPAASTPDKLSPAPEAPSRQGVKTRSSRPPGKALPALDLQADDADILGRLEAEGLRYERSC
jgi:hypothetical protein